MRRQYDVIISERPREGWSVVNDQGETVALDLELDDELRRAGLAREVGLSAVSPGAGSVLSVLAAAGSAKAVVEIGTGTGVSGIWLLRGMRADGPILILTGADQRVEPVTISLAQVGVQLACSVKVANCPDNLVDRRCG